MLAWAIMSGQCPGVRMYIITGLDYLTPSNIESLALEQYSGADLFTYMMRKYQYV